MTCCRTFCRYICFWLRTPTDWERILHEGGIKRLTLIAASISIACIFYTIPDYVVPEFVKLAILTIFLFINLSQCVEFTYTYRSTIFPRMLQFCGNEFRNLGSACNPHVQAIPLDPPFGQPIGNRENPQTPQLRGLLQTQLNVQGPPELFRGQQLNQQQQNPRPVRPWEVYQEMRPTGRVKSRMQQGQSSRPSLSYTQAQPPVRRSHNRAWPSFNTQRSLAGFRDMPADILGRARSLLTFWDEGIFSVSAEGSGEQGASSSHSYYPINYGASLSRNTQYGCPEISQQKLQTGSANDNSNRKSESDDSNRSSRGKGEDNSSNKSSPGKDESRALDTTSSQGGSKASDKSILDKYESNSPPGSSPGKDQSDASNTNSHEKPESRESSPHSHTQSKTSESSSRQQTASLSPGSSSTKSTVIKRPKSGVGLGESNEPIKTHKSLSSKSSSKQEPILLTENAEEPPK